MAIVSPAHTQYMCVTQYSMMCPVATGLGGCLQHINQLGI